MTAIPTSTPNTAYTCFGPVNLDKLDEVDWNIKAMGKQLSQMNRWNGATKRPYSVAQHCLIMSDHVNPIYQLEALMHDCGELIVSDLPRHIKKSAKAACRLEDKVLKILSKKFLFQYPFPDEVLHADNCMCSVEREHFLIDPPDWGEWTVMYPAYDIQKIIHLSPARIANTWSSRVQALLNKRKPLFEVK